MEGRRSRATTPGFGPRNPFNGHHPLSNDPPNPAIHDAVTAITDAGTTTTTVTESQTTNPPNPVRHDAGTTATDGGTTGTTGTESHTLVSLS